eukprot:scaffold189537_cov16-Tisochrysis_lutea.AAC.1
MEANLLHALRSPSFYAYVHFLWAPSVQSAIITHSSEMLRTSLSQAKLHGQVMHMRIYQRKVQDTAIKECTLWTSSAKPSYTAW